MNIVEVISDNLFYLTFWTLLVTAAVVIVYLFNAAILIHTVRMRVIVLMSIIITFCSLIATELVLIYCVYLDGIAKL